jgi:HAAS
MGPADRYLAEVAAHLTLPDELRAEILEELAAHIGDAAADLRAAGHELDVAEIEALARLGPPATLARALVAARRRPAQLLAAAGVGTWAAIGSGVAGAVTGWLVVLLASVLGSLVVWQVAKALDIYYTGWTGGWNTVLTAVALAIGTFSAGAGAVRAVALRGWRAPSEVRGLVALAGGVMLAFPVLFLFEATLNWASVLGLILVPVAFAFGTRFDTFGPLGARALGVLLIAALAVVLLVNGAVVVTANHTQNYSWNEEVFGAGVLPPWWGGSPESAAVLLGSQSTSTALGVETIEYDAVSQQAVAQLRDFRLEAWIGERPTTIGAWSPARLAPLRWPPPSSMAPRSREPSHSIKLLRSTGRR